MSLVSRSTTPPRRQNTAGQLVIWGMALLLLAALIIHLSLSRSAIRRAIAPDAVGMPPIDLTSLDWVARSGLSPTDAAALDAPGALHVTAFPISLNKLFDVPADGATREFTLATRFLLSADDLRRAPPLALGLAELGENWAVYLNGRLLRSEIYRDADGQMLIRRSLQHVVILIPADALRPGENTLVVHLIGTAFASRILPGWAPGFPLVGGYVIGPAEALLDARTQATILPLTMLGIFSFFALYHLLLYVRRRTDRSNLLFALYLLIRLTYISAILLLALDLYPDTGLLSRLAYGSTNFLVVVLLLFLWAFCFPHRPTPLWLSAFIGLSVLLGVVTALCPFPWIEPSLRFQLLLSPISIILVVLVPAMALRERRPDAGKILAVILLSVLLSGWDVLDIMIFHTGMLLGPNGTPLTLSLGLALVLANHFWRVSADAERLNRELAERNRDLAESRDHLEELVSERTTALQLVNTSLELAVDHAQAANRAKSAFLASMSHEIRTPLNAVIGMTALLQDTPLTTEQRVFTDTISIGGQALLSVISDILDFSRIESERLDLEAAPFDLHACFASAIDLVAYAARQKGLVVRYTCAPDVPQAVVGDVGRLRQVLLNLLGNAVKFTDQGAVILDVTSAAHGAGSSQLTITVRDTGIGIAAASLAQIFEPFVQADRSVARRHGGTGLGLAISRQLVALMGGTIDVVSTPGAGTTFTVRITLPHAPLAALPRPVEPAITCARSLRVLVAEDNPINQMVMSHMLTGLGHEVTIVADGQQALRAVAHAPYDVVLMDVQMPELDGEATTRHIRSLGAAITQPHIIALTANALGGDRERYLQVGMDDYLSKPVHPADLQRALARASNGRPSII